MLRYLFSRNVQRIVGWILFASPLIGWPLSALTVASDEPPFILALSWLALVFTGHNTLITVYNTKQ